MFIRENNETLTESPRYMAIDYGSKFIGLASFFEGVDPFPICYDRVANDNENKSIKQILKLVDLEEINHLIVGIPYLLDGKETPMTRMIEDFAKQLKSEIERNKMSCQVSFQDETLSTYTAQERMKNSPLYNFRVDLSKIDSLSAKIILEDFLASQNPLH